MAKVIITHVIWIYLIFFLARALACSNVYQLLHAWCICISVANHVSQVVGDCCGLECSPDKAILGSICVC